MGKGLIISHFVVDSGNAERVYTIFKESHFVKSHNALGFNTQIEFDYTDGVLRIEECTEANSLVEELLTFFVGCDNFYRLTEYIEDGVVQGYDTNDDEGRYFVRTPKTEYELKQGEKLTKRADEVGGDIPF